MMDPFNTTSAHISRFGAIPKNHQANKCHLIVDLSHSVRCIINDGIPKDFCSLTYTTVNTAIELIVTSERGTYLIGKIQY